MMLVAGFAAGGGRFEVNRHKNKPAFRLIGSAQELKSRRLAALLSPDVSDYRAKIGRSDLTYHY